MLFDRLVLIWKIRRAQRLRDTNAGAALEALRDYIAEKGEVPSKDQIGIAIMTSIEANRAVDEYIAVRETEYWVDRAQRFLLPRPKDEAYIKTKYFAQEVKRPFHYFDEETLTALRATVRKEQKERSENFRSWTTLTIGIIGALIGLVAVLKK
jgi:hypothetical protein